MSRRRRKHRPQLPEQETPTPFFVKSQGKEQIAVFMQPVQAQIIHKIEADEVKMAALAKLHAVKQAIGHSQPERALIQQSKALELANQMLAADMGDIAVIQDAVERICQTLTESRFICGVAVNKSFGSKQKDIQLGFSFKNLGTEEQINALLCAAVRATALPELHGTPTSDRDNRGRPEAWVDYFCALLRVLPERPYVITGTPTNRMPPSLELLPEEEGRGPLSTPRIVLSNLWRRIRNLFNR